MAVCREHPSWRRIHHVQLQHDQQLVIRLLIPLERPVLMRYVSCSYRYACGNSKLLSGILKDELGFQGFVQSDWLAQRSGVASTLAGL